MNADEMLLAKQVLAEIRNATGQGYDILVQGTVLSNGLDALGGVMWIATMTGVSWYLYKKMSIKNSDGDRFIGYLIILGVVGIASAFVYMALLNAILGMVAPEYTVLHGLIRSAST